MSSPMNAIKADIAKVEAEGSKLWAWIKSNWGHFVTWAGVAYTILKHL